jgi:hypothetical protein
MPFAATVYRIFIASPSDVPEEREAARKVIAEWNVVHAVHRAVVLLPVGWETHAVPQMMVRPQEHLNETVLRDCDFLIGIFWSRIGIDAGTGKTGTEEELVRHLDSGKRAHLYFSNRPLPMDHDAEQLKRVKEFKAEIQASRSGLYKEFSSTIEFQDQFRNHLNMIMNAFPVMPEGQQISDTGGVSLGTNTNLSDTAAFLLKLAAGTQHSLVLVKPSCVSIPGAGVWQTHTNGQLHALLSDALDELVALDFLRNSDGLGEKLRVTSAGFHYARTIPDDVGSNVHESESTSP